MHHIRENKYVNILLICYIRIEINLGLWHNALNWLSCNLGLIELGFNMSVDCIRFEMNLGKYFESILWHNELRLNFIVDYIRFEINL